MSNDLFKTVKYNDGEGITHGDLNDGQRFLAARLNDQILERLICDPTATDPDSEAAATINVSTAWAYALTVGGAHFKPANAFGAPNQNQFRITPGTLFQKVGNVSGDEPGILAYTFDGTDVYDVAAGHATLARVDMLQMKLEYEDRDSQTRDFEDASTGAVTTTSMNKKRQVKATISWKTGTAAANPTYPTPDAGYVPLCCVVIDNNYITATTAPLIYNDSALIGPGATTGTARACIHDLRMPVNFKTHMVSEWSYSATQWQRRTSPSWGFECIATSGSHPTNKLYAMCPAQKGRIVGLNLTMGRDGATPITGMFLSMVYTEGFNKNYADISANGNYGVIGNGDYTNVPMSALEVSSSSTTNGSMALTISGNGTHRPPVWANGWRGYYEGVTGKQNFWGYSWQTRVCVAFTPIADLDVGSVGFFVAEGL